MSVRALQPFLCVVRVQACHAVQTSIRLVPSPRPRFCAKPLCDSARAGGWPAIVLRSDLMVLLS